MHTGGLSYQSFRAIALTSQTVFTGITDAEVEAPDTLTIWWEELTLRKDPVAGKDWRQEKGTTEDEMVGWHHWLNGHEFERALGDAEGQGNPMCYSPGGRKESDMTERLNKQTKNQSLLSLHLTRDRISPNLENNHQELQHTPSD